MIQGLEKLLFIQTWLTPHHFQLAVLIMLIVIFVFGFSCPNLQSEFALAGCGCVLEYTGTAGRPQRAGTEDTSSGDLLAYLVSGVWGSGSSPAVLVHVS